MVRIDEKQEATIAKIRMAIDDDITARAKLEAEAEISSEGDFESLPDPLWAAPDNTNGDSHWIFGSPKKPINSRALETEMPNVSFKEFDERLRDFLPMCLPNKAIRYEDPIQVSLHVPQYISM